MIAKVVRVFGFLVALGGLAYAQSYSTPTFRSVTILDEFVFPVCSGFLLGTGSVTPASCSPVIPANRGGAGTINGILKADGSGNVTAGSFNDLANISTQLYGATHTWSAVQTFSQAPIFSFGSNCFIKAQGSSAATCETAITAALLPVPTATDLGGVKATTRPSNSFVTGISTSTGALQFAQPSCTDLADAAPSCNVDSTDPANVPDFIQTDVLTISTLNTVPSLSQNVNGRLVLLIVNGAVVTNKGASPAFTAIGQTITWSAANAGFSLETTDTVIAIYTHN